MTIFGRPLIAYAFTLVLWAVSIVYLVMALGFPEAARELPLLVGIALVLFTTIDLVSLTETDLGVRLRQINPGGAPADATADSEQFSRRRQIIAWALVVALVVLLLAIGTLPAIALYVAASVFLLGRRPLLFAIALGLVVAGACYLMFDLAMQVPLFPGLLFS